MKDIYLNVMIISREKGIRSRVAAEDACILLEVMSLGKI